MNTCDAVPDIVHDGPERADVGEEAVVPRMLRLPPVPSTSDKQVYGTSVRALFRGAALFLTLDGVSVVRT